jgi:hypothetical protein
MCKGRLSEPEANVVRIQTVESIAEILVKSMRLASQRHSCPLGTDNERIVDVSATYTMEVAVALIGTQLMSAQANGQLEIASSAFTKAMCRLTGFLETNVAQVGLRVEVLRRTVPE